MAKCEKILIAGFSGAGKTTLLHQLRETAPREWTLFDDLDDLILRKRGKGHSTLASLIEHVGWEKFRLFERQEFESWLKEEERGVLALGGGALSPLVWELFRHSRKLQFIFLDTPFETCIERLKIDQENPRPLLDLGLVKLREIYHERLKVFSEISLRIDGSKPSGEIAQDIWSGIKN